MTKSLPRLVFRFWTPSTMAAITAVVRPVAVPPLAISPE